MKASEIKTTSMDDLLATLFYIGVRMSGDRGTKKDEKDLVNIYKELNRRGIVTDWKVAYEKVTK